jgi:hypothetical protein
VAQGVGPEFKPQYNNKKTLRPNVFQVYSSSFQVRPDSKVLSLNVSITACVTLYKFQNLYKMGTIIALISWNYWED